MPKHIDIIYHHPLQAKSFWGTNWGTSNSDKYYHIDLYDIFRMKGSLSISGDSRRFVFQGVHMLFDAKPDRSWDDLPRRNQLVFIGRNLDEDEMRKGFEECLV